MPITVDIDDHGLGDRFGRSGSALVMSVNEGLRAMGRLIVPHKGQESGPLASETPKRTGKLRRSTTFEIIDNPATQKLSVRQGARAANSGAFYGYFVREGTAPHEIRPVRAKALRFQIGGQIVFARKVNHPGTAANPYHVRVYQRLKPQLDEIIQKMGQRVTAYLSGKGQVA
ncbi:MAG: hypothetical protein PHQ43_00170 [Dehalococcoidales bacterium]|nr:hypothetical protein [Dehalococcoidales bacterium]